MVAQTNIGSTKQLVPITFNYFDLPANVTNGTIPILSTPAAAGTLQNFEFAMPWPGSVVGVTGRLSAAPSAGTLTLQPRINGSLTPFTAQKHVNSSDIRSFAATQPAQQASNGFAAGDNVGLSYTSTSDLSATTIDMTFQVWVLLENVEV